MVKKLICLGMMFLFVFSLTACGLELQEYKSAAKELLETYVSDKGQDNYTTENWATVRGLLEDGKAAIDEAKDKEGVDSAVKEAQNAIDKVPKKDIELKLGYYNGDSMVGNILLYGNHQFSWFINTISYLPNGPYRVEDGKLILQYTENVECIFEIETDKLVYLGAKIEGVFSEEEMPVAIGTEFILDSSY